MPALLPSELPVRFRTRHHWIVLLRPPGKWLAGLLLIMLLLAFFFPYPVAWLLGLVVVGGFLLRWQNWRAEWIVLTGKRLIRVQGVIETTRTESSLRLDRIAGARLIEPVPGKIFGYGTIELEAPGNNELLKRMVKLDDASELFLRLRPLIFGDEEYEPAGDGPPPDEDEPPADDHHDHGARPGRHHRTERLPRVPARPPAPVPTPSRARRDRPVRSPVRDEQTGGPPPRRDRRRIVRGDD